MKKSTVFVISLVVILAAGAFAGAVWATTKPIALAPQKAVLSANQGTVEFRKAGTSEWVKVTSDTEVSQGDSIRTGAGSAATVNYYDQGTARLDAGTTVTFEQLSWDQGSSTIKGGVLIENGRIWSRLLDFLTPESDYQVRTASAVATVRGTAFSMTASADAKGYEGVYVSEHRVDFKVLNAAKAWEDSSVDAGETGAVNRTKGVKGAMVITAQPWNKDEQQWIVKNIPMDKDFDAAMATKHKEELQAQMMDPSSSMHGFVGVAEKVRMAMAPSTEAKQELAARFWANHMAAAYVAAENNDDATAQKMLGEAKIYRDTVGEKLTAPATEILTIVSHRRKNADDKLMKDTEDVTPKQAAGILKRVIDRRAEFESAPAAKRDLFKELEQMDFSKMSAPDADTQNKLNLLRQRQKELKELQPILDQVQPLIDEALKQIPDNIQLPVNIPSTITMPTPTSSTTVIPTLVKAWLTADHANIAPGERAAIHAFVEFSDGSTHDVTDQDIAWSASPDDVTGDAMGSMQSNTFVSNGAGGKTTVTASYVMPDGSVISASTHITVLALDLGIN